MILETDRLVLRPFRDDDVEAVASYSTGPEFNRFQALPTQTLQSTAAFVGKLVAEGQPNSRNDWHFAIQLKEPVGLIGGIRVGIRDSEHQQGDVGYVINPDHWGNGYATEGLKRIIAFAFSDLALERICATSDVENAASCRVLEKVSMQREGVMRHHRFIHGAWRDFALSGCLRTRRHAY